MSKVQVSIPAVVTNLGAGQHTLGLALNLHTHIEMLSRNDGKLQITLTGEGEGSIPTDFKNPVLRAASRLFQHHEVAPAGLTIQIRNSIPLNAGLSLEAALIIGGIIAANNLIEPDLDREELLEFAIRLGIPRVTALTAMMGGLNICLTTRDNVPLHKSMEPPPLKVVVLMPILSTFTHDDPTSNVSLEAALYNVARMPFLIDALMQGDFDLLGKVLPDQLYQPSYAAHVPGYAQAVQAAQANGAAAVNFISTGPTLLAFAPYNHSLVADSMREAFQSAGISDCRTWVVGLDAQGVTVSVVS